MKRTIAPLLTGLLLAVSGVSTAASAPKDVPSRAHLLVVGIVEMPDGCLQPAMLVIEVEVPTRGGNNAHPDLMLAINDAPVVPNFAIDDQVDNPALTLTAGLSANVQEGWRKAALATATSLPSVVPNGGRGIAVINNGWGSNAGRGGNAYAAQLAAYAFRSA